MRDYINREDALVCLPQYPLNYNKEQADAFLNGYYQMWKNVENCAAAEVVERKHGQWIRSVDELGEAWMCSECLEEFFPADGMEEFIDYVHYCPNCGASMAN